MKKKYNHQIIFIFSVLLFSSCGTTFNVTKRHYNTGYYISSSKSTSPQHNTNNETKSTQTISNSINPNHEEPAPYRKTNSDAIGTNDNIVKNVNENSTAKPVHKLLFNKNSTQNLKQQTTTSSPIAKINNLFPHPKMTSSERSEGGLSLFWIIILILLILWIVGFTASVGALINLLLLIALILLILWLLRIV